MNKENIYRAIGNISDKYVVEVMNDINRLDKYSEYPEISLNCSENEGVIKVSVIRKKKTMLRLFVAVITLVITGAVLTAVFMGLNKEDKEDFEKIENYFKEDTTFEISDNIVAVEQIAGNYENLYFSGYMYKGTEKQVVSLIDKSQNKTDNIDVSGYDGIFSSLSIDDKYIWMRLEDTNNTDYILRANRDTLKISDSIELAGNEGVSHIRKLEDGNYMIEKYIMDDDEVTSFYMSIYDEELNEISDCMFFEKSQLENGVSFKGYTVDTDGCYYTLYSDENENVNMYKYNSDGSLLFEKENVTADMEGVLYGAFIDRNGSPVIYTHLEEAGNIYNFNVFDADTGEISQRYEAELKGEQTSLCLMMVDSSKTKEYDFAYISEGIIFGYRFEEEENIVVANLDKYGNENLEYNSVTVCENLLLASGCDLSDMESGIFLCESDLNGDIRNYYKPDGAISKIKTSENKGVYVLESIYSSEKDDVSNYVVELDKNFNIVKRTYTGEGYSESFSVDKYGNIALYQFGNSIALYTPDGVKKGEISVEPDTLLFDSNGECYVVVNGSGHGTSLSKIDFEKNKLTEIYKLDYRIKSICEGFGKYDVCFIFDDGVYGYSIKNNNIKEIINWVDSDIEERCEQVCVFDNDTIVYRYYYYYDSTNRENIKLIRRVSEETLKSIQKRQVIELAGNFVNSDIHNVITEFNKSNDRYRIHINDFSKYSEHGAGFFCDSGVSSLDQEIIKGNTPDMIIFASDFDMIKYINMNVFEELDIVFENHEVKKEDYFEEILDAYKFNGKQYAIPLNFSLNCLSGKQSLLGDKKGISFDKFFNLNNGEKIFYNSHYDELVAYLIYYNISEYIDFEKGVCNFENENFISLLEFIKSYGMTLEDFNKKIFLNDDEGDKYTFRIAKEHCLLQLEKISNFDYLNYLYDNFESEPGFIGLPSDSSDSVAVSSDYTISVFSKSQKKEGAMEFIRYLLSEQSQLNGCKTYSYQDSFPIKKSVFDMLAGNIEGMNDKTDKILSLISSVSKTTLSDSSVRKIIKEQTDIFFNDNQSAEETAKNIQNKVTLYLNEIM